MNKLSGSQIVSHFISKLSTRSNTEVTRESSVSRNVFKFENNSDALIYVKGRACEPHKWGVTKNVVARLKSQPVQWFVVLLYDSPTTGYLLTEKDVDNYIAGVWPLGADGDYKPATGTYLENNSPFDSIDLFLDQLESKMFS